MLRQSHQRTGGAKKPLRRHAPGKLPVEPAPGRFLFFMKRAGPSGKIPFQRQSQKIDIAFSEAGTEKDGIAVLLRSQNLRIDIAQTQTERRFQFRTRAGAVRASRPPTSTPKTDSNGASAPSSSEI